ncbi:MAG: phosphatidate cytidylyltransferase, partial [Alcaligenaceae bacterium]|nr:phosphatidate cytidylyltransferase [Alcaligenaceae bacterium]
MLKQRILTALVLLIIVGAALAASSPWPFLVLLCVIAGCALWEWLRLLLQSVWLHRFVPVLAALVMLYLSGVMMHPSGQAAGWRQLFDQGLLPLTTVFWVLPATVMVLRGRLMAPFGPKVLSVVAVLALFAVWYALSGFYLRYGAAGLL